LSCCSSSFASTSLSTEHIDYEHIPSNHKRKKEKAKKVIFPPPQTKSTRPGTKNIENNKKQALHKTLRESKYLTVYEYKNQS
jgi:hypothetical protein